MTVKRVVRDLIVLLIFCGTFYVSTLVVGHFEEKEKPQPNNFSASRIEGDECVRVANWEDAVPIFKKLTEEDPFNGYAQFRLSSSYRFIWQGIVQKINKEKESGNSAEQTLKDLEQQRQFFEKLALESNEKTSEFLRYRGPALYQLAMIYASRNEFEKALTLLDEFVNDGNWVYNGITNIEELGIGGQDMVSSEPTSNPKVRLHQFEKFWELARKENTSRLKNSKYVRQATTYVLDNKEK